MRPTISFTQMIKEEIASHSYEGESARAILSAFVHLNGRMTIQNRKTILTLETENAKIAKLFYLILQQRYAVSPTFAFRKQMQFEKKITYHLQIEEKVEAILDDLEIRLYDSNVTKSFLKAEENIPFFMMGAFLAGGSCNHPQSSHYHLEIATHEENLAKYLLKLLERNKAAVFGAKCIQRRNQYVVYMKKSDQIVNFVAYIGASDCCLMFEEIRVERDFINNTNRWQICVNANYKKTTDSAKHQLEDIAIIDQKLGIQNIANHKMKILCLLRKENEDASMLELAQLLSEEMETKISKSNINHLFRSIHDLAKRLGGTKNDDC